MPALRAPMQLRSRDDLTKLMKLKGLDDRSLGREAGLHHSTIHRIRTDPTYHTHLDTATAVAEALKVPVDALFRPARQNTVSQSAK